MPITCTLPTPLVSDSEFDVLDALVMKCAYATHNKLGRLCDERVYENDLADRLRAAGLQDVHTQVRVTVRFRDFTKVYRLDLVVNGVVYELKAVDDWVPAHDAQVYHYAALLGIDRIKLLNFGGPSAKGRLRRCPFGGGVDRWKVRVDRTGWRSLSSRCENLANDAEACFREWGGFLDSRLYEEALIAFNGGEDGCVQSLPVTRADGLVLGQHRTSLHGEDAGFVVTSMSEDTRAYAEHLRRLLDFLPLKAWQWINIHHTEMHLVTVSK